MLFDWSTETVDSTGDVGKYASLAVDASGLPGVAYYDLTNTNLKYAHYNGSTWDIETVDATGANGEYCSLAFDTAGNPIIFYNGASFMRVAWWNGSSWDYTTPRLTSFTDGKIATDGTGNPGIAYRDGDELHYATWNGSSWDDETVDTASMGSFFTYISLAFDNNDLPGIAYYDNTTDDLQYAHYNGSTWDIETVDDTTNDIGLYTSIAFTRTNLPVISYRNAYNSILRLAESTGASWTLSTITDSESGYATSLSLTRDGIPVVAFFYDSAGDALKVASRTHGTWSVTTVDSGAGIGKYPSLAINADGDAWLAYYDDTGNDLEVAFGDLIPVPDPPFVFPPHLDQAWSIAPGLPPGLLAAQQISQAIGAAPRRVNYTALDRGQSRIFNAFASLDRGQSAILNTFAALDRGQSALASTFSATDRGYSRNFNAFTGTDRGQSAILANYLATDRGVSRLANAASALHRIYVTENADPDITTDTPAETFAVDGTYPADIDDWTVDYDTTYALAAPMSGTTTYHIIITTGNEYGLESQSTQVIYVTINAAGDVVAQPPSNAVNIRVMPAAAGAIRVTADYDYDADPDSLEADTWAVWVTTDGSTPDADNDPATQTETMRKADGIARLDWTSSTFSNGLTAKVIVRPRRSSDSVDATDSTVYSTTTNTSGPGQVDPAAALLKPGAPDGYGMGAAR